MKRDEIIDKFYTQKLPSILRRMDDEILRTTADIRENFEKKLMNLQQQTLNFFIFFLIPWWLWMKMKRLGNYAKALDALVAVREDLTAAVLEPKRTAQRQIQQTFTRMWENENVEDVPPAFRWGENSYEEIIGISPFPPSPPRLTSRLNTEGLLKQVDTACKNFAREAHQSIKNDVDAALKEH